MTWWPSLGGTSANRRMCEEEYKLGGPDNLLSGCRRHKRDREPPGRARHLHTEQSLLRALLLLRNTDNKLSVPPGNA